MESWSDVSDAVHVYEKLKMIQHEMSCSPEMEAAITHLENQIAKALKSLTTE